MFAASRRVAVLGGTSQVARFLVPRLTAGGRRVTVYSRAQPQWMFDAPVRKVTLETLADRIAADGGPATLFWLPPILLLPPWLDSLYDAGVVRIVAFGTTAMFYKAESHSPIDRDFARRTAEAEAALGDAGRRRGLVWTVLRPTMTYGCGQDDNVTNIARFARRFRCFPLAGRAAGLRQPVHADDLAAACVAVEDRPVTSGRAYNLSGGETLTYADLVARVFRALGQIPVLLPLPAGILTVVLAGLRRMPKYRGLSPDMVVRMQRDLCFDHAEARRDFGYAPGPFRLDGEALGVARFATDRREP